LLIYQGLEKENINGKPSILGLAFGELAEITAYVKETLQKIDDAIEKRTTIFVSSGRAKPDNLEFWMSEDTFYTQSTTFRIRYSANL
jgi:hypothetical protein